MLCEAQTTRKAYIVGALIDSSTWDQLSGHLTKEPDLWMKKSSVDFSPQLSLSPPDIQVFLDIVEQR